MNTAKRRSGPLKYAESTNDEDGISGVEGSEDGDDERMKGETRREGV